LEDLESTLANPGRLKQIHALTMRISALA